MTKKFQKDQKAMALVAVLSIMTILFFLSTAFLWMMDIEREISVNHLGSTQAFYLAQAGLVYGTKAFYDDYTWREAGLTVTLDPGSYTIVCVDHASIEEAATLYSTGNAGNACRTLKTNLSNASFSMAYALLSDGNIGSDTVTGEITGDVHANNSVNPAVVSITEGTVTQGDIVPVPKINMAAYKSSATLEVYTGNQTFTYDHNGTISDNIVYVEADPDYPENPEAEPGLVTIHGVAGGPKGGHVRLDNCLIIAEG
ncbi:MAG: hypothetical protein KAV18_02735, partial [Candidatus Omnitrophica bacterium]|nr:hypothetical protein [Candidatus Omnitrophota bacterium]